MESEEGPAAAAAAAAASSSPPSPPSHPDASPVGSPDHALDDVHALLSDDDHDHDLGHGDDGVQEEDPAAGAGVGLTEDLKRKIIKQVEYYFSDENLRADNHMISWIRKNKEGFASEELESFDVNHIVEQPIKYKNRDAEGDELRQVLLTGLIAQMFSWRYQIWLCRASETRPNDYQLTAD